MINIYYDFNIHMLMGKQNKKSKSKASKKASKVVEEQQIEEHHDEESVVDSDVEVQEDSDSVTEVQETEKKTKKDFNFELNALTDLRSEESELDKELRELEESRKSLLSKLKKNKREQNSIINRLGQLHKSAMKKKEKRKRSKHVESGIQKKNPVPDILIKYLGLEEGAMLARTEVVKKMHAKWRNDGLKDGQTTVLDKKNAKALGYPTGHVIGFSDYQPFIASFFNDSKSSSKKTSKKKSKNAVDV